MITIIGRIYRILPDSIQSKVPRWLKNIYRKKRNYKNKLKRRKINKNAVKNRKEVNKLINNVYADINLNESISVSDVGARHGEHIEDEYSAFNRLGILDYIGFEPDKKECNRLNAKFPEHRFFPHALGKKNGEREIYITNRSGCSSLLKPNSSYLSNYEWIKSYFKIERTEKTVVKRLDEIEEIKQNLDIIKTDTQGFDLEVLKGAENLLEDVLFIETEVHFKELYNQQPLFSDLITYLKNNNFDIIDLDFARWGSDGKIIGKTGYLCQRDDKVIDGELVEADALFMKNDLSSKEDYRKMVLILLNYGKFSMAERLIKNNKDMFNQQQKILNHI